MSYILLPGHLQTKEPWQGRWNTSKVVSVKCVKGKKHLEFPPRPQAKSRIHLKSIGYPRIAWQIVPPKYRSTKNHSTKNHSTKNCSTKNHSSKIRSTKKSFHQKTFHQKWSLLKMYFKNLILHRKTLMISDHSCSNVQQLWRLKMNLGTLNKSSVIVKLTAIILGE